MNQLIIPKVIRAKVTIQSIRQKVITQLTADSFRQLAQQINVVTNSGDAVFIEYIRGMIPDSFAVKRGRQLYFYGELTPIKLDKLKAA